MPDRLNILFLPRWYPNRFDPMPGLFVKRHALAVSRAARVFVIYVHPCPPGSLPEPQIEYNENQDFTELCIYYNSLRGRFPGVHLLKGLHYYYWLAAGYRMMHKKGIRFSLVHVNILTRLGVFAMLLKAFSGTPYIITEHWSRYLPITNTYQGIVRKFLTRLSVRYAGAVTAVTENLKEAMMGHGLYNPVFVVIPNVVDTDFFTPSQSPAHAGKEKILLHVSCFEDKSKNISGILKAIHTLAQKRNDFHFLMVGEGQDLAAMITLAENLGISKKVTFTGLAEGSRLTGYFRQSLALVMFSHYENMPVVINESFSCGTPVIATRVGGIPEVVDESRGILVNPNDEPALCSAIETILDHPERFCNGDIRQYAVQHFGSEAIAAQFLSLYKTVIR